MSGKCHRARQHPGPLTPGSQRPGSSDPVLLAPQALLALPQKLEEVLVVVGGRSLEEDEEGAEEPTPHPANFTFYHAKASEYRPSAQAQALLSLHPNPSCCVHSAG